MKKLILILSTLLLSLSTKLSGSVEHLAGEAKSIKLDISTIAFESIKAQLASKSINKDDAIAELYRLGKSATIEGSLADIIDTLGDLKAIDKAYALLRQHNL